MNIDNMERFYFIMIINKSINIRCYEKNVHIFRKGKIMQKVILEIVRTFQSV